MTREKRLARAGWLRGLTVPEDWRFTKMKYLVKFASGDIITAESIEPEGPYAVYGANGLRGYTDRITHRGARVLVGRVGALCGNVHIVEGDYWASEHALVGSVQTEVTLSWLRYLLQTMDLGQYSQATAQPVIAAGRIELLGVELPPPEEQQAIADYLDRETARIDTLIAEQQHLIEMLRERRRAELELVMTGVKADRAALRYFTRLVSGSGFPVEAQGNTGSELPFFKVKDLKTADLSGVLVPASDTISREAALHLRAAVIPAGSLVFAKVGAALALGRVGALPVDGCIDNNMSALIFNSRFDLEFARYLMLTFDFARFVQPGAVPSLNMDGLRDFRIPLITLARQRDIAAHLNAQTERIDRLIAETEGFIQLASERRKAVISAAVTGQIDLRAAA